MMRPTMSDELPTATGTTIVTGRVGQSCAFASLMLAHVAAIATATSSFPMFPSRARTRRGASVCLSQKTDIGRGLMVIYRWKLEKDSGPRLSVLSVPLDDAIGSPIFNVSGFDLYLANLYTPPYDRRWYRVGYWLGIAYSWLRWGWR